MPSETDFDLLLLAKLTPLKASLPALSPEAQSFTRALINRIENHLFDVRRIRQPPMNEVQQSISCLGEMFDHERRCLREETAYRRQAPDGCGADFKAGATAF